MSELPDELYVVKVNMGSADHGITVCKLSEDMDQNPVYWSADGNTDTYPRQCGEVEDEIRIIYFTTDNYDEAETFLSGVSAMRTMLRRWIDS